MTYSEMLELLRQRIREAATWCSGRVDRDDLEHCLRSPELHPPLASDGDVVVSGQSVEELATRRAAAVGAIGYAQSGPGGRLLVFDPGQSLSDGAAAAETDFLFDNANVPPWDTWLLFVEEAPRAPGRWSELDSYLLCWIPAELVELADRAIAVNPEECLRWADDTSTSFLDAWRRRP